MIPVIGPWPVCDSCELPAILCDSWESFDVNMCWQHGIEYLVFEDLILPDVPWLTDEAP